MTSGNPIRPAWPVAFLAGAVVIIAYATLRPEQVLTAGGGALCVLCGERGAADFVSNVMLFGPLGIVLGARSHDFRRTIASGLLLSFLVEVAQVSLVPGRYATLGDLVANTLGTAAGWLAFTWLWRAGRSVRAARLQALVALAAGLGLLIGGIWLFRPRGPDRTYYLQFTAQFSNMEHYQGEVLAARLGALLFSDDGRIAASPALLRSFERGDSLQVVVRSGSRTRRLAPIVSVSDDRQRELFLLGFDRDHLVFRYSTVGTGMGLDRPYLRFTSLLENVRPGDTLHLRLVRSGHRLCAWVDERSACRELPSAASTWMLARDGRWWSDGRRAFTNAAWVGFILIPVGLLAPRRQDRLLAAIAAPLLLAALPWLLGLPPTAREGVAGATLGVFAGAALQRLRVRAGSRTEVQGSSRVVSSAPLGGALRALGRPLRRLLRYPRHLPDRWLHHARRRHALSMLRERLPGSFLFVCHGNINRSPYAAAAFQRALALAGKPQVPVRSAGFIGPGRPASELAQVVARRRGIDLVGHTSRQLDVHELKETDLVVVMDVRQRRAICRRGHRPRSTVLVLGDLDPEPIRRRTVVDPHGHSAGMFEQVFARIDRCVAELAAAVAGSSQTPAPLYAPPVRSH